MRKPGNNSWLFLCLLGSLVIWKSNMNHETHETPEKIIYRDGAYTIQGAVFEIFNYLKATGLRLGFVVNFGHYPKAQIERIIS